MNRYLVRLINARNVETTRAVRAADFAAARSIADSIAPRGGRWVSVVLSH